MSHVNLKYNCANVRGMGEAILVPGVNKVSAELWAKWESHPEISALVDDGKIVVLDDERAARADAKMKAEIEAEKARRAALDAEKAKANDEADEEDEDGEDGGALSEDDLDDLVK